MNESIGYNCELLKGSGLIHSCFSRYRVSLGLNSIKKDRPMD